MTTTTDMIQTERCESYTLLRMVHGKANALDLEFVNAMTERLEEVEASDAPAIVLTGTDPIFSAGVDLFRVLDGGREYVEAFLPAMSQFFMKLFTVTKPVIAAVNGHAIAGGCVMACAADYSIMARGRGRIGTPELKVGVPMPPVALEIIRNAIPRPAFDQMVLSGEYKAPEEAAAMGAIRECVRAGFLMKGAEEVAADLATIPSRTFALNKMSLRSPIIETIQQLNQEVGKQVIEAWWSDEVMDAIRRYTEKVIRRK